MNRLALVTLFACIALVAGCAANDDDAPMPTPDGGGDPATPEPGADAGGGSPPADDCTVVLERLRLTVTDGEAVLFPADDERPETVQIAVIFDTFTDESGDPIPEALPLLVALQLRDGRGAFADGFTTGSFSIEDAETTPASCGVCAYAGGNYDAGADSAEQWFFAQSGTVSIDTFLANDGGRISGRMTDALFVHVNDLDSAEPVGDDCQTTITDFEFDLPIVAGE